MKTAIKMVQDCHGVVNVDAVKSIITGDVYMFERPKNSVKQDVVVNSLALTSNQLQNGVLNVNLHCPNKADVVIEGQSDRTMPDTDAFITIGDVLMTLLKDVIGFDFKLYVSSPGIPIRDTDGSWYLNIRVSYFAVQLNYNNI